MKTLNVMLSDLDGKILPLGYEGENLYTCVRINCVQVFSEYPDAVVSMVVQPPVGDMYPAVVKKSGVMVVWDITDSVLSSSGQGQVQLTFTNDEIIRKSVIFGISINSSLVANGEAPEPVQEWIDSANETAHQIAHDAAMEAAEEVIESIPEDYTEMSEDVSNLKSAIGNYRIITANRSSGIGQYWNVILEGLTITSGKKIRTKLLSYGGTHLTRVNLIAYNGSTNVGKIGELTEVGAEIEITASATFDKLYYQFFTSQDEGAISAEIYYFDDVLPYSIGENLIEINEKTEDNKKEILTIEKGYGYVADPVISQNIAFSTNTTKNTGIPLKSGRRYTVFTDAPVLTKITYIGSIGQSGYVGNVAFSSPTCSFITTGDGNFGFSVSGVSGTSYEYRFDVYDTTDNDSLKAFIESNGFGAKYKPLNSPIIGELYQISGKYISPVFEDEITFSQGAVKYTGIKLSNAKRYTIVTNAPVGTFTTIANYSNGWAGRATPTSQATTITTTADGELVFATQGGQGTFTVMVFDTTGNDAMVSFIEMYGINAPEYAFDSLNVEQVKGTPKTTVIFTGDSQTQRFTWGAKFKELFGTNNDEAVDCYGYGGENSTQVACTQGGLPLFVEPFTIPAGTTPVEIHLFTPDYDGDLDLLKQNTLGYVGISIDGVIGNITWSSSKQYFTRTEAGSEKTIARPVKVNSTLSTRTNSRLIIELGTNNPIDSGDKMEKLFNEIDCMIRHNGNDAYIVLGLTWRGHAQNIEEVNRMMASRFGQHFLDIRTYLIQYGLEDAGITPTAADEAAIANNNVPPSLLDDEIHFNAACGNVIGQQIYNHGKDLGMWD